MQTTGVAFRFGHDQPSPENPVAVTPAGSVSEIVYVAVVSLVPVLKGCIT